MTWREMTASGTDSPLLLGGLVPRGKGRGASQHQTDSAWTGRVMSRWQLGALELAPCLGQKPRTWAVRQICSCYRRAAAPATASTAPRHPSIPDGLLASRFAPHDGRVIGTLAQSHHLKGCLSECHPSPARGPRIDVVQGVRLTTGIATGRIDVGCKRDRTAPKRRGEDGSDEEIVELDRRFGGAMQ